MAQFSFDTMGDFIEFQDRLPPEAIYDGVLRTDSGVLTYTISDEYAAVAQRALDDAENGVTENRYDPIRLSDRIDALRADLDGLGAPPPGEHLRESFSVPAQRSRWEQVSALHIPSSGVWNLTINATTDGRRPGGMIEVNGAQVSKMQSYYEDVSASICLPLKQGDTVTFSGTQVLNQNRDVTGRVTATKIFGT